MNVMRFILKYWKYVHQDLLTCVYTPNQTHLTTTKSQKKEAVTTGEKIAWQLSLPFGISFVDHYSDATMGAMASLITSITIVYSTV